MQIQTLSRFTNIISIIHWLMLKNYINYIISIISTETIFILWISLQTAFIFNRSISCLSSAFPVIKSHNDIVYMSCEKKSDLLWINTKSLEWHVTWCANQQCFRRFIEWRTQCLEFEVEGEGWISIKNELKSSFFPFLCQKSGSYLWTGQKVYGYLGQDIRQGSEVLLS